MATAPSSGAGASADKPGAGQEAQHDDNAGIHTNWHEQNPGAFHHLSKTHKENVRRRLSSIGPVIEEPKGIKFPSCRLVMTMLAFFGFLNIYCLRVNLSVALVAMVNSSQTQQQHNNQSKNATDACGNPVEGKKKQAKEGEFNWDETQQGIILSAFFYGYVTTQIAGGMLSERFGGKRPLLFGIFWTSALTILTPVCTRLGDYAAIVAVRILEGIGEGVTYPSMHAMLSVWAPPQERSRMVTTVYAGSQIGVVLTMPVSGVLCQYLSWDYVFYVFGALGVFWSVLWLFLVTDTPAQHPRIDPKELTYIEHSRGLLAAAERDAAALKVPWLSIAKSLPVWAVAIAHFTNNWGYYTLLTCLPMYLKNILHFDMKSNGALSGLPYLVMWLVMIVSGFVADLLRRKHILSTTNVRKLCNTIGFLGPAACLVGTGFIECNKAAAVAVIVIAVALSGISMAGWAVNHLDLAPPFAGTLMGITNMIATIPGFVSPTVVGLLTNNNQTAEAWRCVFYIAGGVYVFGTVFYCVFGSGRRQHWAETEHPDDARPAQ